MKKESLLKKTYKRLFRYQYYFGHLQKWLADCESVLDLGCGNNSPLQFVRGPKIRVCVEAFHMYICQSREKGIHNEYIKNNILSVDFEPKSFDAVIILDVLEHLPKKEALELLEKAKKWARKKVIVSTPNGEMPTRVVDNNPMQAHISYFTEKELHDFGFLVYGFSGWKKLRDKAVVNEKPVILWQIISDITQLYTHSHPKHAFRLCAVLILNNHERNSNKI